MSEFDETARTLLFDAPSSYVGRSVTRPNARRLTQGRGQYVDDIVLPRMLNVAYVRSPHAHAKIVKSGAKKAAAMPGVMRIVTGAEIAMVCKPYVGVLTHLQGMRSPPQYPLAVDVARWQGEPVVAVVAQSRAEAEDAVEMIEIVYEELPAALDAERALDPSEPKIHPEFDSNLCFQRTVDTGGVDAAMSSAHLVVDRDGNMTALEIDDLTGVGPYSMFPRSSGVECNQILNLTGGPYKHKEYRAKGTVVFQNKNMMCQYRAVGHPIAVAVAEHMVDQAAAKLRIDPAEMRRRNLIPDDAYPCKSPSGMRFEALSHQRCLEKLLALMKYDELRGEQAELRKKGVYRGIGLSSFIEVTNPSPMFYGVGGARIAAQDGCTIKLDASGAIVAATGVTEQGQGTETIMARIAATALGVERGGVEVLAGETDKVPYGGGTWASRAAGIGGEAVLQAGLALKHNILEAGAVILKTNASDLDIADGKVVKKGTEQGITLAELARICYYRGNELPVDFQPELVVTRHYRLKD